MNSLIKRKEVAEYFGLTPDAVRKWEKKGIITPKCFIAGRPRYDLEDIIKAVVTKEGGKPCN